MMMPATSAAVPIVIPMSINDDLLRVAVWACRLGYSTFIAPFLIIYKLEVALGRGNAPLTEAAWNVVIASIATYAMAVVLSGRLRRDLKPYGRALLMLGWMALCDLIGLTLVATALAFHVLAQVRIVDRPIPNG